MRTLRRSTVALLGLTLVASACGGSSEPTDTADEPIASEAAPSADAPADGEAPAREDADLVVWTDDQKVDPVTELAEKFGADNGISVAVQVVTDLQSNFLTANSAGNGPDVVVGAHDWIGNMVQNGAVEPLQLTPDQLGEYSQLAVDATAYEGSLYGLPYGVESLVLYRNTDAAPAEPTTLEEAFDAGEAAVAAGTVESPFNLQVGEQGDAYHMQPLYTSAGGYVFGGNAADGYETSDLGIGQPGSVQAAQKIGELGEGGRGILRRSISEDNSIALFAAGKAAFLVSGPWALRDIEASGVPFDVSPMPGFADGGPAVPFSGVQAFFVASQGANKAFAQEFVANALNTEEAMKTMYDGANIPPSRTSLQESEAASDPRLGRFVEAALAGSPMPANPAMASVFEPLGQADAAIVGGADPAQTMQSAGQTISDAIAQAG